MINRRNLLKLALLVVASIPVIGEETTLNMKTFYAANWQHNRLKVFLNGQDVSDSAISFIGSTSAHVEVVGAVETFTDTGLKHGLVVWEWAEYES